MAVHEGSIASPQAGTDDRAGKVGELIDKLRRKVEGGERVSIGLVQQIAGQRAVGPLLLLPALVVISPLSIVPGVPSMMGLNTILVAGQVALGRETLWLPNWLAEKCVPAKFSEKLLRFLTPAGRLVDKVAKPRASATVGPLFRRLGAVVCVLVGMIMPLLEFIPFTSTWAASIIAVYALAITAKDGFLALAWLALVFAVFSIAWMLLA